MKIIRIRYATMPAILFFLMWAPLSPAQEPGITRAVDIGSRLELMVDDVLIDRMDGLHLQLQTPRPVPMADSPMLQAHYATVIKDGALYRAYYRSRIPGFKGDSEDGHITCYAESADGITWRKPNLGLIEINGSRANNVVLHESPFCHNFSPFLDVRPAKDRGKRFKAVAGMNSSGLYGFESDDGLRWKKVQGTPVIPQRIEEFDSQNVAFWSEAERCYVCYFRAKTPKGALQSALRTVSRAVSPDFLHWSEPVPTASNLPGEHLYTSQTHPYYRAPHIYIALPTRLQADHGDTTDILFMTARAGSTSYTRQFKEAFIRPGLDRDRWGNRSNYTALNVVPTGPTEMSIYHSVTGLRYVLRIDGFASARAGYAKGELLTKPLMFSGKELILNYSTSAGGGIRVEIQAAAGTPLSGFRLEDCPVIIGDEIEGRVAWKQGPNLGALRGTPVRLRFVMTECDLFSFRFR